MGVHGKAGERKIERPPPSPESKQPLAHTDGLKPKPAPSPVGQLSNPHQTRTCRSPPSPWRPPGRAPAPGRSRPARRARAPLTAQPGVEAHPSSVGGAASEAGLCVWAGRGPAQSIMHRGIRSPASPLTMVQHPSSSSILAWPKSATCARGGRGERGGAVVRSARARPPAGPRAAATRARVQRREVGGRTPRAAGALLGP